MVLAIAVVTAVAILLPVYVIHEVRVNAEVVLAELELDQLEAAEQVIRVSVATIACMLLVEPADRTIENMNHCIREGLNSFFDTSLAPGPSPDG